ncbi:hypothetical protein [Chitinophaga tropicalis]|uniref:Uncharacterized protein n=1 Tax=Chitinophaga tropicalis TaxID=2683588 RepID=A0A7K1U023_9BACT|nr:hypothetical protein [Chitinophaga tropicalis]MVT07714.1 hypothetical protein [Chitinophaga tropicalis]
MVNEEIFQRIPEDKSSERYLLTIGTCYQSESYDDYQRQKDLSFTEHIEYAVLIKNKKALFRLVSMEMNQLSKSLITIFLYTIGGIVNIEASCICVPARDTIFLDALKRSGYEIGEQSSGCYNVVKGQITPGYYLLNDRAG